MCLALLLACTGQEPGGDPGGGRPALVSLSLLQAGIAFGDSGFEPRPVPFSPEVFHPDSMEYTAKVLAGSLAVIPAPMGGHGVTVQLQGVAVPESRWRDGRPCFVVGTDAGGDIEVVVRDSADGDEVRYVIHLDVKSPADPESPSLAAMTLEQVYYYRYTTYGPKSMTPGFHPDTLEYAAVLDEDVQIRLMTENAVPGSELTVRFNDSILQPAMRLGDTAWFLARFVSAASRLTTTVKDVLSGKQRSYVLTLEKPKSLNTGEWVPLGNLDSPPAYIDFVDGKTGFIASSSKNLRKTTDGGKTWVDLPPPFEDTEAYIHLCDFSTADSGYLLDGNYRIWGTSDGGGKWSILQSRSFGVGFGPPLMAFPNARIGYIAAGNTIFRTQDGGATWVERTTGMVSDFSQIVFVAPFVGYVSTFNGTLLRTKDGGDTWEEVPGGRSNLGFFALDSVTLWVNLGNAITKTQDGGRSWHPTALPIDHRISDFVFTDAMTGFMSMNEGTKGSTLLKTVDGGSTWTPQYKGVIQIFRLAFPETGTGFAFGSLGELLNFSR